MAATERNHLVVASRHGRVKGPSTRARAWSDFWNSLQMTTFRSYSRLLPLSCFIVCAGRFYDDGANRWSS
jgi:hypothetical protein